MVQVKDMPDYEEYCDVISGPILKYKRTYFNEQGLSLVDPVLKISINGGEEFYANEEVLIRMREYLTQAKQGAASANKTS